MRIHHIALRVADLERSLAFYTGVLGLPERRRAVEAGRLRAVWLEADGAILMLERSLRGEGPADGSGHLLAFAVDDLGAWQARLADAGLRVDDSTPSTLYVRDPDGHRVGLSAYRDAPT